jgi:hypothetical protein
MCAQIQTIAAVDLLIEVKQCAHRRDVVCLGRLAPGGAILGSAGNDYRQTQRHPQGKAPLFIIVWGVHQNKYSAII